MEFKSFSSKGNVRQNNEDNYLVRKEPCPVIVVADGMGGHKAGDVASQMAVDLIKEYDFDLNEDILKELEKLINIINDKIIKKGEDNIKYKGMGTTLSLALIYNHKIYIGHIGDSRIYLFRNDKLKKITTDDSLVNELIKNGRLKPSEAFDHPKKHILTQALGIDKNIHIETNKLDLENNDLLLFCTDGLTDMIREEKIEEIISGHVKLDTITKKLGKKALENGGSDNITLVTGIIN